MIGVFVFCSLLAFAAGIDDACPDEGPVDQRCPLQMTIDGQVTCFKVEGEGYRSYTPAAADKLCRAKHGDDAHLANVYSKAEFTELRCLIIKKTTSTSIRDKKVLTGMRYNKQNHQTYLHDGTMLPKAYWGENPMDWPYGDLMVFRAHEKLSDSELYNYGTDKYRFKRILCEYPIGK